MEQTMNSDMGAGMGMNSATMMGTTQKQGKGMMMGMIACTVLAVAGIGFGVYEMTEASKAKNQISDLKIQIQSSDGTTSTIETDKIEVKEDDKTVVITDSAVATENVDEYIFIGEWGLKIKKPDTLKNLSYDYHPGKDMNGNDITYLSLRARKIEDPSTNVSYQDDFMQDRSGLLTIGFRHDLNACMNGATAGPGSACENTIINSKGEEIGIDFWGSQNAHSADVEQQKWEVEARATIIEWFTNTEHYSAF